MITISFQDHGIVHIIENYKSFNEKILFKVKISKTMTRSVFQKSFVDPIYRCSNNREILKIINNLNGVKQI